MDTGEVPLAFSGMNGFNLAVKGGGLQLVLGDLGYDSTGNCCF